MLSREGAGTNLVCIHPGFHLLAAPLKNWEQPQRFLRRILFRGPLMTNRIVGLWTGKSFRKHQPSSSLCDENLLEKKSGSIGESQVIRNGLKIATTFLLLYRNGLEQKCFSPHIHRDLN